MSPDVHVDNLTTLPAWIGCKAKPKSHLLHRLTVWRGLQLAESQKNDLEARDRLLRLQVGVDVAGEGEFVMYAPRPGPRGSIDVGAAEVQVGRRFPAPRTLHLRIQIQMLSPNA